MFSSDTFSKDMLSNPALLAKAVIDAMETSDSQEITAVTDPNNGFVMSLLADVAIFSKLSEKIDYVNNYFYRNRARTAEQLYTHLSEYDYISLMASPATLPFYFAMSKDWIIANAVYFDSNYNRIQIPATSYITMGGVVYSMYYPIDILVNRNTSAVTAFYNTDVSNSLYTPETNMLLDVREYTQNGLNYFQIQFNMFQFERKILPYTVASEQGFNTTLSYEDQFYAVKVLRRDSSGNWVELAYSLSRMNYDYTTPTALIKLLTDSSQVKIEIPQIYFHNGLISQNIKIELYTTKGAINYSLTPTDVTGLRPNFDTGSSAFAAPLEQMPTWTIIPSNVEIQGGSNAKTYLQMRDAVVNNRLHSRVAITMDELIEAGVKAGFTLTRYVDDLTERIYYASNILRDSDDMVIPTFTGSILLKDENLTGNPSSIINFTDGYKTLLPTTIFKIIDGLTVCEPLTDSEVNALDQLSKSDLVTELNKGVYVRQPFHITLLTTAKSPKASIYNLLSPTVQSLSFIAENSNSAPQMSILAANLVHQNDGTGGYQILVSVGRSSNIRTADVSNFNLYFTCYSKVGELVYLPATYIGVDANGDDIWEVILATNYHITTDGHISMMLYNSNNVLNSVEIPLTQTFTILTSFFSSFDPNIPKEAALNALLPSTVTDAQVVMSQQELVLEFGKNLSERIYCGVNTSWGNDVYDTADETVYHTTNVPLFLTNENGVIETRISETNNVEVVQVHNVGDIPPTELDLVITTAQDASVSVDPGEIALTNITGILIGMTVMGLNVPVGATVTAIDDLVITLSLPIDTIIPQGTSLTFINPVKRLRTSVAQNEAGATITVTDTSGLLAGQSVFGFGVASGSTIDTIVDETQFTLSQDTTEALVGNQLLLIKNMTAPGTVKVAKGEVLKDPSGDPIVVKAAENQYRIPTILFDGRLFASDIPNDQEIVTTIAQRLQNFANQIETLDEGLTESSDVYYKPARTMGQAKFGIGNNESITLPLGLSFEIAVYVDEAMYNTLTVRAAMTTTIYAIINEAIQSSPISASQIASTIKDALGSNIQAVEIKGINGQCDLRLIALEDKDCSPGIEYTLTLLGDGSIDRVPNIVINYVPKPATLESILIEQI